MISLGLMSLALGGALTLRAAPWPQGQRARAVLALGGRPLVLALAQGAPEAQLLVGAGLERNLFGSQGDHLT